MTCISSCHCCAFFCIIMFFHIGLCWILIITFQNQTFCLYLLHCIAATAIFYNGNVFSSNLELLLYARLMDACKVDLTLETFRSTDKRIIVKSLLSKDVRQTARVGLLSRTLNVALMNVSNKLQRCCTKFIRLSEQINGSESFIN